MDYKPTTELTNDIFILHIDRNEEKQKVLDQLRKMQYSKTLFAKDYPTVYDLNYYEYFIIYNHQFGKSTLKSTYKADLQRLFNIPSSTDIPIRNLSEVCEEFEEQENIDIQLIKNSDREQETYKKLQIYRRTPDVTFEAIQVDPQNILLAPAWSLTKNNILYIIEKQTDLLEKIDAQLIDTEIYHLAFKLNVHNIKYIPFKIQTEGMAWKAVLTNGWLLNYITPEFIDQKLCLKAFETYKGDHKFELAQQLPDSGTCLKILRKYGEEVGVFNLLKSMKCKLIDTEIASLAIELDPRCYLVIPEDLRVPPISKQEYEDLESVSASPLNFLKLPIERRTEMISFAAVCTNSSNFPAVHESVLSERIIKATLKDNATFIEAIPVEQRTEKICQFAIEHSEGCSEDVLPHIPRKYHTPELYKKAVEKSYPALGYIKKEFRTKELCRIAYQNMDPWEDADILESIPHPDIILEAVKYFNSNHMPLESVLEFLPRKVIGNEIADWVMDHEPGKLCYLPKKFQTIDRALITAKKSGCTAVHGLISAVQLPEVHLEALKNDPEFYFWLPKKYLTPKVDLYIYKYCANEKDRNKLIKKYSSIDRNNIFTFNIELEKRIGGKIDYDTILKIYQGENTIIDKLETPDGIKKNVRISFDHSTYKLEIQSDGAAICNCTIRNNVEEYLKNNTPSNPSPGNKDQCLSK